MLSDAKLAILERFGDADVADLVAEARCLRDALQKVRANANVARRRAEEREQSVGAQWKNVEFILDKVGLDAEGRWAGQDSEVAE